MSVVKDMALTPEDFFRGLEAALGGRPFEVDGHRVTAGGKNGCGVSIAIRPLPARTLGGLLSVARTEVRISFRGCDEEERASFLETFDRAYQRGGG